MNDLLEHIIDRLEASISAIDHSEWDTARLWLSQDVKAIKDYIHENATKQTRSAK